RGGPGDDRLRGGRGEDVLRGGRGDDRLDGGAGADGVGCGPGADTAVADAGDLVKGSCRDHTVPQPPQPPPPLPPEPGAPVAVDDTAGTDEDTVLELPVSGAGSPVANDTDPDGDPLTV